jgi:YHS domain-containing protein
MKVWCAAFVLAALLVSGAAAQDAAPPPAAAKPEAKPAPAPLLCPVTKAPADRKVAVLYRGKWVYFATADAKQAFEKSPLEFADGVKAQWDANKPVRIQTKCPVTGHAPGAEFYTGIGDDAIFFATAEARDKYTKDPTPYLKKLDTDCYTFQTSCGTCGMEAKATVQRDVDGKTIYFCCDGCADKFAEKQAEYLKKVDDQIRENQKTYITRQFEKLIQMQKEGEAKAKAEPKPAPATQPKP